jgi:hypothetical protein
VPQHRAGMVAIVSPGPHGPAVHWSTSMPSALDLLQRWIVSQCTNGCESVWLRQGRQWVPLGNMTHDRTKVTR